MTRGPTRGSHSNNTNRTEVSWQESSDPLPTAALSGHQLKNASGRYVPTMPPHHTHTVHCCIPYLVLEAEEAEEVNLEVSPLSSLASHLYLIPTVRVRQS